jgi:predicted nucleic acid-binding Zn ribbon protein
MERASRLLGKLRLPSDSVAPEALARAAWPIAVGKIVAAHTRVFRLIGTRLVVETEDATWMRQLAGMSLQIRTRFNDVLGRTLVEDLEFRVGTPRREMQRAASSSGEFERNDEAERIADPVMRGIYRAARKKAMA